MDKSEKIWITGSSGMVGKSVITHLMTLGYTNLLLTKSSEVNLLDPEQVNNFYNKEKPDYVIHLAARVGGIKANMSFPADFLFENLMINSNIIHGAYQYKVKKLINLGSSCIYPRESLQPMKEEYLLTGPLEPTNEGYAIGKIAGLKLCHYYNLQYQTNFISLMPPNMYGPFDHFEAEKSHVISANLMKLHKAKMNGYSEVVIWGTGNARREFLYVDDLADGLCFIFENYDAKDLPEFLNIGTNEDLSIRELVDEIKNITGFQGELVYDSTKPDGMPKKLMDSTKIQKLGWRSKTNFRDGLKKTYQWYLNNLDKIQTA